MNEINFIKQTEYPSSLRRWFISTVCTLLAILIISGGFIIPRLLLLRTLDAPPSVPENPTVTEYHTALQEKKSLEARQHKRTRKEALLKQHITLLEFLSHIPPQAFERVTLNEQQYEIEGIAASMKSLQAFIKQLNETLNTHASISSIRHEKDHLFYVLKIDVQPKASDPGE